MFMLNRIAPALITLLLLGGCSYVRDAKIPGVYRIDIQQGNVIDENMVARLEPGMDKNQVQYIMGTPVVNDPFHANRWDYVYTYSKGGDRPKERHVVLHFRDNKLASVSGDVKAATKSLKTQVQEPATTVEVPPGYGKEGFFQKLLDVIPFVGDDSHHTQRSVNTGDTEAGPDNDADGPGE